jgi:large subunit ribosomal protein L19e
VRFDPSRLADISDAITADDVRKLINDGVIKAIPKTGVSSYRKKNIIKQKRKGRRKGIGSRKGRVKARNPKKKLWISRIRAIRKLLKELKRDEKIDNRVYRTMYMKSKSGFFRNKAHIMIYLERNKLLKEKKK